MTRYCQKVLVASTIAALFLAGPLAAFTADDAQKAVASFNTVFWDSGQKCFRRYENKDTLLDFWMAAHTWETVMDAYERNGLDVYRKQIDDNYDGFVAKNGTEWTWNKYNDDITWWVVACLHAYRVTHNQRYLDRAKYHFDWLWANEEDTALGGGIYWTADKLQKNACVNCPAAIAALELSEVLNDDSYLSKGKNLYAWVRGHLYDAGTGAVYDHQDLGGAVTNWVFTYNQGTFIGAAQRLSSITGTHSYLTDACRAADFTKSNLCNSGGILRSENQGDGGTFKLVCVRYLAGLVFDGGQTTYSQWLYDNANTVWKNRRPSDGIMGFDWANAIPSGTVIESQSAAGGVCLMNLLPPDSPAVAARSAFDTIQAELYNHRFQCITESLQPGQTSLGGIQDGSYAAYYSLNFGSAGDSALFLVRASSALSGGSIEVRLNGAGGQMIGTCSVGGTGSWMTWQTTQGKVAVVPGKHDVYLIFRGSGYLFNVDWFGFFKIVTTGAQRLVPCRAEAAATPDGSTTHFDRFFSVNGRAVCFNNGGRPRAHGIFIVKSQEGFRKKVAVTDDCAYPGVRPSAAP